MRGVLSAVAVGKSRTTGALVLDPAPETDEYDRLGCFAFIFTEGLDGQVVWADWHGGSFEEVEVIILRVIDWGPLT